MSLTEPADPPTAISVPPVGSGYATLVRYTLAGLGISLLLGLLLDRLHLQQNGFGHWAVRVLAGQGESLCEGMFAAQRRLLGLRPTMAEAYGWGKVTGMIAPWLVDAASSLFGVNTAGIGGFYIPFLYGMSDQVSAQLPRLDG